MNITIQIPSQWLLQLGLAAFELESQEACIARAKAALDVALDHISELDYPTEPEGFGGKPAVRMMFRINSMQASMVGALAAECRTTVGPMAKRLIGWATVRRASEAAPAIAPEHPMSKLCHQIGCEPRLEQAHFYDNLVDSLSNHKIGMVEGGTGIGKTRAMVHAALQWIAKEKTNAAISVPTVALLRQFASEYTAQALVMDKPPELRMVMGRREFVSLTRLEEFLAGPGGEWNTVDIQNWVAAGGMTALESDDPWALSCGWQMESLLSVCASIPRHEIELDESVLASDPGFKSYKSQFFKMDAQGQSLPAGLLLFTHAMLAQDVRRRMLVANKDPLYQELRKMYIEACVAVRGKKRLEAVDAFESLELVANEMGVALADATQMKGLLPDYECLQIDEAHQFDQIISSASSEYLSLRSLQNQLQKFKQLGGKIGAGTLDDMASAVDHLTRAAPKVDRRDFVMLSADVEMRLLPSLQKIGDLCNSISAVRDRDSLKFLLSLNIRRAGKLITTALDPRHGRQYAFLRHSPIRALPQLIVSNVAAQTLIGRLWMSIKSCALVSATLYIKTSDGYSGSYMQNLLNLPEGRVCQYPPVHAPWNITSVSEMLVAPHGSKLTPPSYPKAAVDNRSASLGRSALATYSMEEARWHSAVGEALQQIHATASGGVLVLCTSLATCAALRHYLLDVGYSNDMLVVADGTMSVQTQSRRFLQARKDGLKCIWLAVGGAWTGLDIGGHSPWKILFGNEIDAALDDVLTDLVIPRIPFRTNQSLAHLWRMRVRPEFPWDYLDAALRFTQGIGRLIRREIPSNAPKRRIHLLDSRLSDPERRLRLVPFLMAIRPYQPRLINQSSLK